MKKKIFAINGSAGKFSTNLAIINWIGRRAKKQFDWHVFETLSALPHFDPELSVNNPPLEIIQFRQFILEADAVIICTPEYVFSIPAGLKNAIEWCVSTTVFSKKPLGLITASAQGEKAQEELRLILNTLEAIVRTDTTVLIQGVKGKMDHHGEISDAETKNKLDVFWTAFERVVLS